MINENTITNKINILEKYINVQIFQTNLLKIKQNSVSQNVIDSHPGVYCFFDDKSIYIGESVHPFQRLEQHRSSKKLGYLDNIIIFRSEQFHKSAIYDIETKLIDYIAAEQKLILRNRSENQKEYNYFLKYAYESTIKDMWTFLMDKGLVYKSIEEIEKTEIFKFSPYKALNSSQRQALKSIGAKVEPKLTIIKGMPGTGKSVLASRMYMDLSAKSKVCLTSGTHPTINAFKKVFKLYQKTLSNGSNILKTSQLLKSEEKFDVIIVDEAHRLMRKTGKGHPGKVAHIKQGQNELQMLLEKFDHVILFYDENQIVHDADMNIKFLEKYENKSIVLNEQMRSLNGYEYINFIVGFLSGSKDGYKSSTYDFVVYDSFKEMHKDLKTKSKKHPLTRVVSGYTREWLSKGYKDNDDAPYDFNIEGVQLRWNGKANNWIYSDNAKDLSEVGYYHTVQGFDLDYVGVIIGRDLYLDENNELQVNEKFIMNNNEKPNLNDPNRSEKLKQWVLNRYKILLTRGAQGVFVYVEDERLKDHLKLLLQSDLL